MTAAYGLLGPRMRQRRTMAGPLGDVGRRVGGRKAPGASCFCWPFIQSYIIKANGQVRDKQSTKGQPLRRAHSIDALPNGSQAHGCQAVYRLASGETRTDRILDRDDRDNAPDPSVRFRSFSVKKPKDRMSEATALDPSRGAAISHCSNERQPTFRKHKSRLHMPRDEHAPQRYLPHPPGMLLLGGASIAAGKTEGGAAH